MSTLPRWIVLTAVVIVAAGCAAGGAPSAPPATAAPTPKPTTNATLAPTSAPTDGPAGGMEVDKLLGSVQEPPGTTWARVSDPGATFSFEVPTTWNQHLTVPWEEGGTSIGTLIAAGPDPSKLGSDLSVPGVGIGVASDPGGRTPRQVVEGEQSYASACTANPIEDGNDGGVAVSAQRWTSCAGGGNAFVASLAPADGSGLIGIVFQGTSDAELGYLPHILGSLQANATAATPAPAPSTDGGGQVSGDGYTIKMDYCQNQHGQGVSGGLIRNDTSLVHSYRIVVAFYDPNGVLLNDTWGTTPNVPAGVTAEWQAVVPSGLPNTEVKCQITGVELAN